MSFEEEYGHLHRNQKWLVKELIARGIKVTILDSEAGIIRASYKKHDELILDRDSSIMPYAVSVLAGNKMITKRYLQDYKTSVPIGCAFYADEEEFIKEAFRMFGTGVVIKPTFGSYGHDVYIDLRTEEEVSEALRQIKEHRGNTEILIEEYFDAPEYRIFITREGKYAVLNREPAYVIGNGINTISELIELENKNREDITKTAMCTLVIDEEAQRYMRNHNISFDYIPKENEKVRLRYNSNVATGGVSVDYTDLVHPTVIKNCLKVFQAFPGLPYAGIDYMSKDITKEQRDVDYRIIEVNTNPGANMHMLPGYGESRNISEAIADMIYPETREENKEGISKIKIYKKMEYK
ncbi:MAG TPA: hypothetical protein DCE23_08080 [Firmicutes bacterium]|nr:hypothetical protein [Bacillota bacterium]